MINKKPIRMCLGCNTRREKSELFRVVADVENGLVFFDAKQRLRGRGAYFCGESICFQKVLKKNKLSRALRLGRLKFLPQEIQSQIVAFHTKQLQHKLINWYNAKQLKSLLTSTVDTVKLRENDEISGINKTLELKEVILVSKKPFKIYSKKELSLSNFDHGSKTADFSDFIDIDLKYLNNISKKVPCDKQLLCNFENKEVEQVSSMPKNIPFGIYALKKHKQIDMLITIVDSFKKVSGLKVSDTLEATELK